MEFDKKKILLLLLLLILKWLLVLEQVSKSDTEHCMATSWRFVYPAHSNHLT